MGKMSRRKGRKGEQDVVLFWRSIFPNAKRHLESQAPEAELGYDVELDDKHRIQVKVGSKVPKTIYDFVEQLKAREEAVDFVQCRKDKKEWLIVIKASKFKEMLLWFNKTL